MQVMESSYPLRPGEPDCRDYLRTGRCKYGDSCKYNHPTNVEVGGGVKPTNPGEPLFPVRPNEPPCQYFLKHGTCKFGQSCKFNHPSGMAIGLEGKQGMNNTALPSGLVFLTTNNAPAYTIDSNGGIRHSGSLGEVNSVSAAHSNVQILPQRPNEQNCIYFLRNGRCKYGEFQMTKANNFMHLFVISPNMDSVRRAYVQVPPPNRNSYFSRQKKVQFV